MSLFNNESFQERNEQLLKEEQFAQEAEKRGAGAVRTPQDKYKDEFRVLKLQKRPLEELKHVFNQLEKLPRIKDENRHIDIPDVDNYKDEDFPKFKDGTLVPYGAITTFDRFRKHMKKVERNIGKDDEYSMRIMPLVIQDHDKNYYVLYHPELLPPLGTIVREYGNYTKAMVFKTDEPMDKSEIGNGWIQATYETEIRDRSPHDD